MAAIVPERCPRRKWAGHRSQTLAAIIGHATIGTTSRSQTIQAHIIANPAAAGGRGREEPLQNAVGYLAAQGWTVSWRWTEHAGHAEALARQAAAAGISVVVVAGGDGTVNEVVNGLVGTETALAVLPAGTGNVLAAQLGLVGIPTPLHRPDPPTAARLLCRGSLHRVDTGFATPRGGSGRHFLLWAGIGLDAAIAHELEGEARDLKRTLGPVAYGALGIKTALEAVGTPAIIRADGQRLRDRLLMGVVANIPLYGGAFELTPEARLDDGLLDLELFAGGGWWSAVGHLGAILTRQRDTAHARPCRQFRHVRIVTERPVPVHLDAEPYGTTPVTMEVCRHSLRLLVPPSAPESLFIGRGEPLTEPA